MSGGPSEEQLEAAARALGGALREAGWRVAVAESSTGGLIGHSITMVPGSSDYFPGGVISYSNQAKEVELGVPATLIAEHGEGLHHACLSVDDVHEAVERSLAAGAILKECKSCGVTGVHEHPEGWIAFLAGDSVPGMEIEYMQVYKEGEMPERFRKAREV